MFRTGGVRLVVLLSLFCTLSLVVGCGTSTQSEKGLIAAVKNSHAKTVNPIVPMADSDGLVQNDLNETSPSKREPADGSPPRSDSVSNDPSVVRPSAELSAGENDKSKSSDASSNRIEILVKNKTFRNDKKTGALVVSFEDLDLEKVLDLKEIPANVEELMPGWMTELSGKKIRVRGFMKPTFSATDIEIFVLARDTQACCFGPNPKIDYLILVKMKDGKTTEYIPTTRAFDVVGKFKIKTEGEDGKLYLLYCIDDAEVIDR